MPFSKDGLPSIATFSGLEFVPSHPTRESITLVDIAHGLGSTCRYAGQLPRFYSVAEHSILVCLLLEKRYPTRPYLWQWGLMHDAAEAYIGDMPRPLKSVNPLFQAMEAVVMGAISEAFSLCPKEEPEEIHDADMDVFLKEKEVLWKGVNVEWWHTEKPPEDTKDLVFRHLNPGEARHAFLTEAYSVFGRNLQ